MHAGKQGGNWAICCLRRVAERVKGSAVDVLLAGEIIAHGFSGFPGPVGKQEPGTGMPRRSR